VIRSWRSSTGSAAAPGAILSIVSQSRPQPRSRWWRQDLFRRGRRRLEPGLTREIGAKAHLCQHVFVAAENRVAAAHMDPPCLALYLRFPVFGNDKYWEVLRMRHSITSGSIAAIACLVGMSPPI
jgi:hypothetical protein